MTVVRALIWIVTAFFVVMMFYPLVLGYGKRLFEDTGEARTLKLVETRACSSGIVVLTYQPVPGA